MQTKHKREDLENKGEEIMELTSNDRESLENEKAKLLQTIEKCNNNATNSESTMNVFMNKAALCQTRVNEIEWLLS